MFRISFEHELALLCVMWRCCVIKSPLCAKLCSTEKGELHIYIVITHLIWVESIAQAAGDPVLCSCANVVSSISNRRLSSLLIAIIPSFCTAPVPLYVMQCCVECFVLDPVFKFAVVRALSRVELGCSQGVPMPRVFTTGHLGLVDEKCVFGLRQVWHPCDLVRPNLVDSKSFT